jgi:hypothetical protein
MLSIIFTCIEISCEMKGDDNENKKNDFKRHVNTYC